MIYIYKVRKLLIFNNAEQFFFYRKNIVKRIRIQIYYNIIIIIIFSL